MKASPMNNPSPASGGGPPRWGSLGGFLRQAVPSGLPLLLLLVFLLLVFLYATCTQYLEPDQFAVKQVDVPVPIFTGPPGIHTNIYDTGIHWRLPGCEKFIVFPRNVRA